MKTISIKEHFEARIEALWQNPKYDSVDIKKYGYFQQDNQTTNSLLFIGINPSNSKKNTEKYFYTNGNKDTHPYFKKFIEISEKVNLKWSHLDLLFVRETNQSYVKELVYHKEKVISDFFWEQLLISKEMIEMVQPKIIVVNNSLARDLLGFEHGEYWLGYKFKFDESLGTHYINTPDSPLFKTPVFFTSMLTGQRALDNGSFRRLVWHIDMVNKTIK